MTPHVDPTRFGFLGPAGTFTEMALNDWPAAVAARAAGAEPTAYGTVDAALADLRKGTIDAAMVPIENSVEGGVSATLDALATGDPLVVVGERVVPVTFVLAARAGTRLEDVHAVGTHSHAWAQVRGWMGRHLPGATYVPTLSTASAAEELGRVETTPPYAASVSAPVAAQLAGLTVLAEDIGDIKGAVTRFALVARPGALPRPTGADKTTVVLFQRDDHAGGLQALLDQFSARGINMTRLESRPTKDSMGSYCFSVDFEGHVKDERVGEALMGLKRICSEVVFLGSYPRADGKAATVAPLNSDEDFRGARDWLRHLRHGV